MILPLIDIPFLGISIENPFNGRIYPEDGRILAVMDTGYEGFLMNIYSSSWVLMSLIWRKGDFYFPMEIL